MLPQQRTGGVQLRLRAGRGEPRGDTGRQSAAPVPPPDQRLALVIAALRRVEQGRRRVAVHQHLAGNHQRAELLGRSEQRVDGVWVDRAVDRRRGGAVAHQLT